MWSLIVVVYESEIDQEIFIYSCISLFIGVAFFTDAMCNCVVVCIPCFVTQVIVVLVNL